MSGHARRPDGKSPGVVSRRDVMRAATAGALLGTAALRPSPLHAQQPPALVRSTRIGDLEVTVLTDGHMLQQPSMFGTDLSDAERMAALAGGALDGDRVKAAVNVTLVRTASDLVLIDVGSGPNFLETTGKLADSLAAAAIDPKAITLVVFTHGHPDHLWGAIDEFDDSARFPNARYVISDAEWALWMTGDPTSRLPADRQNFIPGARRNLGFLKDWLTTVKSSGPIAPGLTAIDTAGHTQGHISVGLSSGNASAIVLGDALIHPAVSFAHPDWRLGADHEPDVAARMRRSLLDRLAADRTPIIGYHLPFPGLGHVERRGPAFAFVPST